jgi:hypothetical protein
MNGQGSPGVGHGRQGPPILLAAFWFAVLGGVIEATWHAFRWLALGDVVKFSAHFAWMAPLGNIIVFTPIALGLLLLNRMAPRIFTRARAAGLFAFLAMLGVMLMFDALHRVAMVVVALGLAVQVVRRVQARPERAHAVMRPTAVWLMAVPIVVGITIA